MEDSLTNFAQSIVLLSENLTSLEKDIKDVEEGKRPISDLNVIISSSILDVKEFKHLLIENYPYLLELTNKILSDLEDIDKSINKDI